MPVARRRPGGGPIRIAIRLLVGLGTALSAGPAAASRNVTATLVAEQASVEPGRPFTVGLRMKIRHGWHTYWKNPGDSGLPLRITWRLPEGFAAGPIDWPAPKRIEANAEVSYGYDGEALFPIEIAPPERLDVGSVTVAGTFEWLECADVCVPGSADLSVTLPVRSRRPSLGPAAPLFDAARSRRPTSPPGWAFSAETGPRAVSLSFRPPPGIAPRRAVLFVGRPLVVDYAAPQGFERADSGYRLTMTPAANAPDTLARLTGVLVVEGGTVPGGRRAILVDAPATRGDPTPAPAGASTERSRMPDPWRTILLLLTPLGLTIVTLRLAGSTGGRGSPGREPKR